MIIYGVFDDDPECAQKVLCATYERALIEKKRLDKQLDVNEAFAIKEGGGKSGSYCISRNYRNGDFRMTKCRIEKILNYFKNDPIKMLDWYATPNPGLGNISPFNMLELGRHEVLHQFINNALEGNRP